MSKGEIVIADE